MKHWFNRPPSAPSWASFWSGEQYGRFVEHVKAELGGRGVQFEMGDGVVRVRDGRRRRAGARWETA